MREFEHIIPHLHSNAWYTPKTWCRLKIGGLLTARFYQLTISDNAEGQGACITRKFTYRG